MTVRDRRGRRAISISDALAESARKEIRLAGVSRRLSRADIGRAVGIVASQRRATMTQHACRRA